MNYTYGEQPLVIARVPSFTVQTLVQAFEAADPLAFACEVFERNAFFRQAIFVASPDLYDAAMAWRNGDRSATTVPLRVFAYLSRMCSRATPFGLFAGVDMVQIADSEESLRLAPEDWKTRTRPDMSYAAAFAGEVASGPSRYAFRYITNPAIIVRGDRVHLADVGLGSHRGRATDHRPVSLRYTNAVRFVCEMARLPVTLQNLATDLSMKFNAAPAESEALLDRLVSAGILLSEIRVSPVGNAHATLGERLSQAAPSQSRPLAEALDATSALDEVAVGARTIDDYQKASSYVRALAPETKWAPLHVDLRTPLAGALPARVLEDAALLGTLCMRMGRIERLNKFRKRFLERYEGTDRLVPLRELADANLGLGYPDQAETDEDRGSPRDALLLRMASEALASGLDEIVLSEEQLAVLLPPIPKDEFTSSIETCFSILASDADSVKRGDYLLAWTGLLATNGAAKSAARFLPVLPEAATDRARALAAVTVEPDTIKAELVFAPLEARAYNVQVRPAILDREIRLGIFDWGDANAISLDDIWVGLDSDRFYLWSASLRKRIEIGETHAFNTRQLGANIIRLITLLARDGRRAVHPFMWGSAHGLTSLPRVRYKNLVLSPRRWRFDNSELGNNAQTALQALKRLRETWRMPRYVVHKEYDNYLMLDLDSAVSAKLLLDQISGNRQFELEEALPDPGRMWIQGPEGPHNIEFAVSLVPREVPQAPARTAPLVVRERASFGPGSAWVYAKIYTGEQMIDDLLLRCLHPFIQGLERDARVDRWFFLRYADPQHHLRVRLHSDRHHALVLEQFTAILEQLLREQKIQSYAFATYEPEYERYGGADGVARAEHFFTADSTACVNLLPKLPPLSDHRIAAAAASFVPWIAASETLMTLALDAFAGRHVKLEQADRAAFKRIGAQTHPVRLAELEEAITGERSADLLTSFFHMHCNRLGVTPSVEIRARALLRALVLSLRARKPAEVLT